MSDPRQQALLDAAYPNRNPVPLPPPGPNGAGRVPYGDEIPNFDNAAAPVGALGPPPYHTGDLAAPALAPSPPPLGSYGGTIMQPQTPPVQPGVLGIPTPYPVPAGSQSVPPPPGGSDSLVAQGIYPDGGLPADPNAPLPPGATIQPPLAGATPTTAAAAAMGFPQSAWSLALHQRMDNGGIGQPMDFYNFVKNRGVMPPVDPNAQMAQPMQRAPRPVVIGPTNTSPAQIIPQAAPQGQGGPPPPPPPMPQGPAPAAPVAPGQIPGGVPANPQMPGFYPQRMLPR